jgi:hypothetical protein
MLREVAERADATDMSLPHEIRRAGERRRKRLAVATATCAVLGAVAAGLVVSVAGRDTASVDPAGQPTPSTSLGTDDRVGFVGPPPRGTSPTGPATGELVAAAQLYNSGTWVYADGRIINALRNAGTSDQFRGYAVRQLTPAGVEAMRSYLLDGTSGLTRSDKTGGDLLVRDAGRMMFARDFDGCGAGHGSVGFANAVGCPAFTSPENWLPASAWEDSTFRPFVPHTYMVCLSSSAEPAADVPPAEILPTAAVDVWRDLPDTPLAASYSPVGQTCRVVANSIARELADILDEVVPAYARPTEESGLAYDSPTGAGGVMFEPVLPHGATYCTQCG